MAEETKEYYQFGDIKISTEEVEYWHNEIKLGRAFRKKYFYDDESGTGRAIDCLNYYLGKHKIYDEGVEIPIADNQISPIVKTFLAAILFQNPEILVRLLRKSQIPYQKEITKSVFSYFQTELKMDWQNQLCIFDSFITGVGLKTNGYDSELDEYDEVTKVKEKVKKRKGLGRGKGWETVEEEIEKELRRKREWIVKEFPYNLRHSPFMCIPDPRAKCALPYDGKWLCLEYDLPFYEVKGNKNFQNTSELAPNGAIGTDKDKIVWDDYKKAMCRLYQIQISRSDGMYILTLCKDYDKPIRYIKYPFKVEGFLTTFLTLNDTCDTFYPPNDIEGLIPLQDEVNYIQSRIVEAIYKFLPKVGLNSDFFRDEQEIVSAVEKNELGSILVNRGQATPNQAIQVLNFNLDLQDKLIVLQNLRNEMRLLSGVTEAELTGQTDAKTATEANIGARGSFARIIARRERVRRFLKEDLRKFKQICMQACDWPLITKITGLNDVDPMTGQMITEQWVKLNRVADYIVGEYELDVDIASGQVPNPELKRRQILETANFLFSPLVEQSLAREGMKIDKTLLIKEFLRTMEQFREAEGLIVPLNDTEKKALASQMLMQNGVPQKMATAPQGPPQSDMQSMGEMVSQTMGNL